MKFFEITRVKYCNAGQLKTAEFNRASQLMVNWATSPKNDTWELPQRKYYHPPPAAPLPQAMRAGTGALNPYSILSNLTNTPIETETNKVSVYRALAENDLDALGQALHAFFASIPNDWYRKNQLANYEGYYASIVYCYFAALGVDVRPEESTNKGRIDLVIRFQKRVYVIEFKVLEMMSQVRSLKQIKDKGYAEKFAGQEAYLIGVEFSSQNKNIERYEWEAIAQQRN